MNMNNKEYIELNRNAWNNKVESHVNSDFYNMKGFLAGETSLNSIELEMLGDLKGKSVLHLQCHFGQDTLSLARMGAEVTGVDLSDVAIEKARHLNQELGLNSKFICCDIYDLHNHLDEKFDIVFTSYGTIGWFPDLDKWARLISKYLKPNGRFIFVDFHPFVWMYDNDFTKFEYSYFKKEAIVETETGTYADREADLELTTVGWNHSISEVVNSLLNNGIQISALDEFDFSPYNCFKNMEEFEPKKYRIKSFEDKLPLVYAIEGLKK
jgi:2-polyprenyl-3-methyl-5-hydroxy-6-metoxy-1,4-benzoquinol methylase